MRIHRILIETVDDVGEETSEERVALELEGALWDVSALDRVYRGARDPSAGFFERVIASGARDLDDWEARLASGSRPRGARIDGAFTWLPPFDGERSLAVGFDAFFDGERPVLFSPRAAVEHAAAAPLRGTTASVLAAPAIAALLVDVPEPGRPSAAVLGLSLALMWLDQSVPPGAVERVGAFSLGPGVTSVGAARETCHACLRVGVREQRGEAIDLEGRVLAAVVRAADAISLGPGDLVIVPGRYLGLPAAMPALAAEPVELSVGPLGVLGGRWVAAR